MAKPAVGPASPPTITARQDYRPLPVSAQRRRRRTPPAKVAAGPSSSVLSLLATISAASSSADGSPVFAQPTPPPFLCPYIARDNSYDQGTAPLPDPVAETSASALSPPTPTLKIGRRGTIADKFVQGSDGMYRRVDKFTLYGSTVCSHCEPTIVPNDDAIQPSAVVSSPSSESPDEFAANMPNGWKTQPKVNNSRVMLILAISLVLAFVICVFMAAFIIWRRKKRRRREKDEELKLQKSHDTSEHQELVEKEARLKQKFWTRASARWKANVRSSARRRRNRRVAAGARTPLTVSVHDFASAVSVPRSTSSSSRRPLSVSAPEARSSEPPDRDSTQNADDTISVFSSTASSPPAYIYNRPPIQIASSKLPNVYEAHHINNERALDPFSEPTHDDDDNYRPEYMAPTDDDPIPYDDSYHAGHVAIDDKSLLAQMVHLASAPPPNADEGGSSALVISAPDWHDEELERVIDNSLPHGQPSTSSFPQLFPAPPAKDKMATPSFYEYPYSFEEDADSLALEPSAPPFEQHAPSAPPLEDAEIVPSAPPLPEEPFPSTPDWVWEGDAESDRQQLPSFPTPVPVVGHLPSYRA